MKQVLSDPLRRTILVAAFPFRWAPVLTLLVGVFLIFGFVATGDFANMTGTENVAVTVGKWLQFVTLLVGTVAAVISLVPLVVPATETSIRRQNDERRRR